MFWGCSDGGYLVDRYLRDGFKKCKEFFENDNMNWNLNCVIKNDYYKDGLLKFLG